MRPEDLPRFRQSPTDPAFVQDPNPTYARMRALGPAVFWEDYGHAVFTRHAQVSALLRDRRFGREVTHLASREALGWDPIPDRLAPFHAVEAHSLLEREPPAHTRLRRLVNRAFTSRAIAGLAPRIEAEARRLVDAMPAGPDAPFDLVPAFAEPLPMAVIAHMLGAPAAEGPRMLAWSHDMVGMYQAGRTREDEDRAAAAAAAFADWMRALIARRRAAPGGALIDALIAAEDDAANGGGRLSEDELVSTCILLLNAGHEATAHALGNAVHLALTGRLDPAVFANPASDAAAETAADETLRFDAPLHMFTRFALGEPAGGDATVGKGAEAVTFRLGETIGLLLGSANRDAEAFPDPDRLDPARANAARHVSFGAGIHFCVGAPLARMELRIGLRVLFAQRPGLCLAAPATYRDAYHFHGLEALRVTG